MARLVRNFAATAFCVVALTVVGGATALAAGTMQNPTTGQHGSNAGNNCGSGQASMLPGGAGAASGSPFNPAGEAGTVYAGNQGTASSNHANSTAAVSQYDVACLSVTGH